MAPITPVVVACIVIRDHVLTARQMTGKSPENIGKFGFPGGKIEYGETPEQALTREIKEELNACIDITRLLHAQSNLYSSGEHNLVLFYQCVFSNGQKSDHFFANSDYRLIHLLYPGFLDGQFLPGTSTVFGILQQLMYG